MATPIAFESTWKKADKRKEIAEAREQILNKAKSKYEHELRKQEDAKKRGEGSWMLPGLDDRIKAHNEESKAKSKKKKKKDKKKKKKKKKKNDSSSSDSSESGDEWVEKPSRPEGGSAPVKGPQIQRDSWMMAEGMDSLLGGTSTAQLREEREQKKEQERQLQAHIDQPGQHSLELNPYWRDGGTGLPEEQPKSQTKAAVGTGTDGGLAWLQQALKRCEQQAAEEGRSLEDVAADRYGSLESLQQRIQAAEEELAWSKYSGQSASKSKQSDQSKSRRGAFKRPGSQSPTRGQRSGSRERAYVRRDERSRRSRSRDRNRSRSRDRKRSRSRSRDRKRSRSRERRRSRSRDRRKSRSRSKERRRSRSRSRERRRSRSRDRKRSRDRDGDSKPRGLSSLSGRFRKPRNEEEGTSHKSQGSSSRVPAWKKTIFKKPGEEDRSRERDRERRRRSGSSSSDSDSSYGSQSPHRHRFKKPDSQSPSSSSRGRHGNSQLSASSRQQSRSSWMKKKAGVKKDDDKATSRSKQNQSSSSSSSSESESSSTEEETEQVKILTEQEKNQLGAKILRAELMGNQALADKLKAELEASRQAEAKGGASTSGKAGKKGRKQEEEEEEDQVVVLTRTDAKGMVRPIREGDGPVQHSGGGRKKKKRKITTHDKDGQRDRYFADDDNQSLRSLVEQERMGTTDDSNMLFAKLAGRSMEKVDDDHQVDDVILNKAAKSGVKTVEEERERAQAIMEHKRLQKSMEKCQFCFDRVPKHLIVAIGVKCYLCLPNHKSLSEGHCLIVPMQHVSQATALDEDVWDEIQIWRKVLVRMFSDRDEDVVFMETCMNLRYNPHMVLECVPMDKEVGDMAPIYFKKAIQECEGQWADNKKLVDLNNKDIRRAIPKGFPYFSVNFAMDGGFAHVIEDEKTFPFYFGREIVGGMLDLDPSHWRKPRKENFDDQRRKVLMFADMWKPYDWTKKIDRGGRDSD